MKLLPRYVFHAGSHTGCGKHKNPDCLCDVKLTTNNTTEIRRDLPHPFFQIALDELGDDTVTERNFVEVCSVALGAHETFRFRSDSAHTPISGGPPEFQALDEDVALALRDHYRVGTPWRIAQLELDCVAASSKPIRDYYNRCRSWHTRAARSQRAANRAARKRDIRCENCGGLVENADTRRKMCSDACRMAALRTRRRLQYSGKVTG